MSPHAVLQLRAFSFVLLHYSLSPSSSYIMYILSTDAVRAFAKSILAMYLYFIAALLVATAISQDIQLSDVPSCGVSQPHTITV